MLLKIILEKLIFWLIIVADPYPGFFRDLSEEDWENAFKQVLLSVVRFSNLVIPKMIEQEWGRIVNITSIAVKQPVHNLMLSNSLTSWSNRICKIIKQRVWK